MQAGSLNERITIQRRTRTSDGMGGYTEAWADLATVWSSVTPARGRSEVLDGQRIASTFEFRAVIHWRQDSNGAPYYTAADRVIWKGRTYGIANVAEPRGAQRRSLIEITMVEGEAS